MKYFGTDGIRGHVNTKNINGDMFFKFGLAAGKYFTNLKKKNKLQLLLKIQGSQVMLLNQL
jgi:phosphoglucosamine mutase